MRCSRHVAMHMAHEAHPTPSLYAFASPFYLFTGELALLFSIPCLLWFLSGLLWPLVPPALQHALLPLTLALLCAARCCTCRFWRFAAAGMVGRQDVAAPVLKLLARVSPALHASCTMCNCCHHPSLLSSADYDTYLPIFGPTMYAEID
jgi:hypothetical protein